MSIDIKFDLMCDVHSISYYPSSVLIGLFFIWSEFDHKLRSPQFNSNLRRVSALSLASLKMAAECKTSTFCFCQSAQRAMCFNVLSFHFINNKIMSSNLQLSYFFKQTSTNVHSKIDMSTISFSYYLQLLIELAQ